jgi:hypothetical protein
MYSLVFLICLKCHINSGMDLNMYTLSHYSAMTCTSIV